MTDLWLEEHCQVHCFNLVNNVYILDYYELVRHQILFHWSGVKPEAEPVIRGRCFVRSGAVFCVWLPLTALHTCAGCPGQARNHQNLSRCWCPGPWLLCWVTGSAQRDSLPLADLRLFSISGRLDCVTAGVTGSGVTSVTQCRERIDQSECKARSVQCSPQCNPLNIHNTPQQFI